MALYGQEAAHKVQPTHELSLPRRGLRECLAEELRRLDPDDVYGDVLRSGLDAGV